MEARTLLSTRPPIPTLHFRPNQTKGQSPPSILKIPKLPPKFSETTLLPLHSKNPHIVLHDLQRLARLGKLRECLTVLDYLEFRGIPVNVTTFSALLSACSRSRSLATGRQIHVHIRINGLASNEFLLTKLVEMYAACGSPEDARKVFDDMPTKSVYPWNALLHGNVVSGRRWSLETLNVFSEMRELGVDANEYSYACLIKSFAGSPALLQGMKVHGLLIKNGYVGDSLLLQTSLIDMYFKCGKVRMAMKVFDEIPERDIVLFGAVIAGFAHNSLKREALEYLRWMGSEGIEPNSVIVTMILPVIGELADRKLGREVHGYVLKRFRNYHKLVFVHSGLIDMYCKCGDMVSGRHVFYRSRERNVVSWTALMSGYASNGRFEQALRSLVWMQQERVTPDVVAIATALPVCAQLKALKQGKEIHAYALKHRFLPNISLSTSLMTLYAECGKLDYSSRVFVALEKKSIIAWTALIDSNLKNQRPCDALDVFRTMNLANCRPDAVIIARILSAAGCLGTIKIGKEIHGQVLKLKLEPIPFVIAEVVHMYGKCGDMKNARIVFDRVQSIGSLTVTAIIEAYGYNFQYRKALALFDHMLSKGFIPNHYTFNAVLRFCEKEGLHDKALELFDSMVWKYNLKASEENYDCIISLLNHVGRIDEAQRFVHLKSTLVQT
ncbi:Tetratricopeptide-like helical domain-containing protein [Dioscorea alata]|uniref:Tetratricopeptide-like helical domain-containing protein n=1 Tax=Dioscorea alata TaxID=55571 RepID=A0ACB7VAQ9_DIOAL|nr:Tetratricopeptide-like helical domain-containing protein [Dioscorea alata]